MNDCSLPHYAKGACRRHYDLARYRGTVPGLATKCKIAECPLPIIQREMCMAHARRETLYGDPMVHKRAPAGSKWINEDGYVQMSRKGHRNAKKTGAILEHRYIMSEHLGRPLEPHENVHHKNGNRADNRLDNLELWTSSQPKGKRVEDAVAYAAVIVATYGLAEEDAHQW